MEKMGEERKSKIEKKFIHIAFVCSIPTFSRSLKNVSINLLFITVGFTTKTSIWQQ
jgi:hypothetical protein